MRHGTRPADICDLAFCLDKVSTSQVIRGQDALRHTGAQGKMHDRIRIDDVS
jgi:hypothetical protein